MNEDEATTGAGELFDIDYAGDMPPEILEAYLTLIEWFFGAMGADDWPDAGISFDGGLDSGWTNDDLSFVPGSNRTHDYSRIITNLQELYYFGARPISESHFMTDNSLTIRRTYRLPLDAPEVIRLDGFTSGDMSFTFDNITRISDNGITQKHHSIIVELRTDTSDALEIRSLMHNFIMYEYEGYEGILYLVEDSLATNPIEYEWERFYIEETHIYENLPFGDVENFATFFIRDGIGFAISDIEWLPLFDPLAAQSHGTDLLYNAVVTYTGWYSRLTTPGFITQASYEGDMFNFQHFPSVLYEVSFVARSHRHEYSEINIYADETPKEAAISISPAVIWLLIAIFLVLAIIIAAKLRWLKLGGLASLFRRDSNEQEHYFEENDEDKYKW